jgi:predicted DNA-binding transcriptional regulator AlpA
VILEAWGTGLLTQYPGPGDRSNILLRFPTIESSCCIGGFITCSQRIVAHCPDMQNTMQPLDGAIKKSLGSRPGRAGIACPNSSDRGSSRGGVMEGEGQMPEPVPLLIGREELLSLLGISRAHLSRLLRRGAVPLPIRLGRSCRWSRADILAWVQAKCPPREKWYHMSS